MLIYEGMELSIPLYGIDAVTGVPRVSIDSFLFPYMGFDDYNKFHCEQLAKESFYSLIWDLVLNEFREGGMMGYYLSIPLYGIKSERIELAIACTIYETFYSLIWDSSQLLRHHIVGDNY